MNLLRISRPFSTTLLMFSSVAGVLPFTKPMSVIRMCWTFLKPANSNVFLAQSKGQPSMASNTLAASADFTIPLTRPPIPARQAILPAPSAESVRPARSVTAPVSAAPEQGNIIAGALPHPHEPDSLISVLLRFDQGHAVAAPMLELNGHVADVEPTAHKLFDPPANVSAPAHGQILF